MGNSPARNCDLQKGAFFSTFPEDILVILTDLLSTSDFIHLITTCKYYYHDYLGGKNMLWSRVCRSLGGVDKIFKELKQYREGFNVKTKELDLTDKNVLASIDFKKEIYTYYMLLVNTQRLRRKFGAIETPNIIIKVHPFSFWTNLSQYWTNADLKSNKYPRDYYYEVDLTYDPVSVEEIHYEPFDQKLPHEIGGRIIVYKKSTRKARRYDLISRSEYSQNDLLMADQQAQLAELIRITNELSKEAEVV